MLKRSTTFEDFKLESFQVLTKTAIQEKTESKGQTSPIISQNKKTSILKTNIGRRKSVAFKD